MQAHASMLDFSLGERVAFQPEGRTAGASIVTRYSRKTVTVVADNGQQGNVAPAFLRQGTVATASQPESCNVIALPER